jgi:tetratricopeptide (TPR) repeat protein
LDKAYSDALRSLANKYPDDADIATLFAESLMDQHPWDLWLKDGTERPWTPEIIAALERSIRTFPDHFGAHHLYIHAVEASRTPERALPSAAFLSNAVPGSGHLTHMPSHIYIRTGRYHEGVLANQRSVTVDSGYTAKCHAEGVYPIAYFPHNIHFVSACAVFTGQKKTAWRSALDLRAHLADDLMHLPDFATLQHYDAFPWMVAVKLGLWPELAAEAMPDSGLPYARALWHFAQGVRRARTGDVRGARTELTALQELMKDSLVQTMSIWGINRASHLLRVAEHVLQGELSSAEGKMDEAVRHFTMAVATEDSLQYQEPPDWTFPTRHELGNVLLKAGDPTGAEKVFSEDLVYWPENGYALEGLWEALAAQKKTVDAEKLAPRITAAWQYADR